MSYLKTSERLVPAVCSLCLVAAGAAQGGQQQVEPDVVVSRALSYLSREVQKWPAEHGCYSCHNSGDAARVLYLARRRGLLPTPKSIRQTTRWLAAPDRWHDNGGAAEFSDKKLERLQFTLAASAAAGAGLIERRLLEPALTRVLAEQQADGSWQIDTGGMPGSPITWGTTLATALLTEVLAESKTQAHQQAGRRGRNWLRAQRPRNVTDAAATLIGIAKLKGTQARAARRHSLDLLRGGQRDDGGWGTYVYSASTEFDTALALIGLAAACDPELSRSMIQDGRRFLVAAQDDDGSWLETVRDSDRESYAHRVSTTAWVTLALIDTAPRKR